MTKIATDDWLLRALREAAHRGVSKDELLQQRIDYITACLFDEGTEVTASQVAEELRKMAGEAA